MNNGGERPVWPPDVPAAAEARDGAIGPLRAAQGPTGRILWNRRGEDIDELVVHDVAAVHIEQMTDRMWWIGIERVDGGYWSGNFVADRRGRMRFTEQAPPDRITWDEDRTHEDSIGKDRA